MENEIKNSVEKAVEMRNALESEVRKLIMDYEETTGLKLKSVEIGHHLKDADVENYDPLHAYPVLQKMVKFDFHL